MFFSPISILSLILLALIHLIHAREPHSHQSKPLNLVDKIPLETRVHWMRKANAILAELDSPCPFAPFSSVVVNHSDTSESPHGKMVCYSVNESQKSGNPILHGEIATINNCSKVLTDPNGGYKLTPHESLKAFKDLSLYTNAEPCPMCASAIRWSTFAECIYGTSIPTLISLGWNQISIRSSKIFENAGALDGRGRLVEGVLSNETDPYFAWQFSGGKCPVGCERGGNGGGEGDLPLPGSGRGEGIGCVPVAGIVEGKTEL